MSVHQAKGTSPSYKLVSFRGWAFGFSEHLVLHLPEAFPHWSPLRCFEDLLWVPGKATGAHLLSHSGSLGPFTEDHPPLAQTNTPKQCLGAVVCGQGDEQIEKGLVWARPADLQVPMGSP